MRNKNSLTTNQKNVFNLLKFLQPHCAHKVIFVEDNEDDVEEDENDEKFLAGKQEVDNIIQMINVIKNDVN